MKATTIIRRDEGNQTRNTIFPISGSSPGVALPALQDKKKEKRKKRKEETTQLWNELLSRAH